MAQQPDSLYHQNKGPIPFEFNQQVAQVFNDMINRSVPDYQTILHIVKTIAETNTLPNTDCYDLGCSLGEFSRQVSQYGKNYRKIIALDNSTAMLEQAQQPQPTPTIPIQFICADITQYPINNASLVLLNYTLQFIPLEQRYPLLQRIYQGLKPGGILLLSEKILPTSAPSIELSQQLYADFKKNNGYNNLEISRKREALENVLIPETETTHYQRLQKIGFQTIECINKKYLFCTWIAWK